MGSSVSIVKEYNNDEKQYLLYCNMISNPLWLFMVLKKIKLGCIIDYNIEYIDKTIVFEKILSNNKLNFLRIENTNDKNKLVGLKYIISIKQIDKANINTTIAESYYNYMNYLFGEEIYQYDFNKKSDICVNYNIITDNSKQKIFSVQKKKKQFDVNFIMNCGDYQKELENIYLIYFLKAKLKLFFNLKSFNRYSSRYST